MKRPLMFNRASGWLGVVLALVFTASSFAQSGGTYTIQRSVIAGGGGLSSGGTLTVQGTTGQHDADDLTGGTYTLRGGFWHPAPASGPTCTEDSECQDDDVCTLDVCDAGTCVFEPNLYGDIDASGIINIFDLFCVLDGFSGDFSTCSFEQDDVTGTSGDCSPNGIINIFDLFEVLDAFAGIDPCCTP